MESSLLVAQITDTHLFADGSRRMKGCPTLRSLQHVVQHLCQQSPLPEVLLMTGDLSQDETRDSYEQLRAVVAPLGIPAYWLPGNHDQDVAEMAAVLNTPTISPQKCFQQGGWNFVLLNTMVPQQVQGRLSTESLDWLAEQLENSPELPTLVALHHPPLPIASAWMDAIALENAPDLFAILDRHAQVKLVVFGHIHQEFSRWRGSVHYVGTPSTCVQFLPQTEAIAIDKTYPGFRLLQLFPDGSYETWVERVAFEYTETATWE